MIRRPDLKDEPYCSNCGYVLKGLTESSKCPECGKPLVEVLARNSMMAFHGKRWRSRARLFGIPVIDIAIGPHGAEMRGRARGIIAIGDIATGGLALGGMARGIVAIGGMAIGLCALGGSSIGLLTACGGLAVGGMAVGGMAIGGLAMGGGAVGLAAEGGQAFGFYARDARGGSPSSQPFFEAMSWYFGQWPPRGMDAVLPLLICLGITLLLAALITVPALLAANRDGWAPQDHEQALQ